MRKIGPRLHLAVITVLWGVAMLGMGFVKDWEQLTAMRVVLGIFEAGKFFIRFSSPPLLDSF